MKQYVFDKDNFRFRQVTTSIGHVLWRAVKWLVASFSLAALFYVIVSLFISTDTERQLARENRAYERNYAAMQERLKLVEENLSGLELRDDAIYGEIFHTRAPQVDPVGSIAMPVDGEEVPENNVVAYTERKARSLSATAAQVDSQFLHVFAKMAGKGFRMPPMRMPLEGLTYAQTGAGTGNRLSPFYKVEVPHNGLDLIAGQGESVFAVADGTVRDVIHSGKGLGNVVEIDHGNGYVTRYGHLADITVSKGQKVSRGRKIATVGISGNSFAPHLHYEVLRDGTPVDPVNYLFAALSPKDYANVAFMAASTEQSLD